MSNGTDSIQPMVTLEECAAGTPAAPMLRRRAEAPADAGPPQALPATDPRRLALMASEGGIATRLDFERLLGTTDLVGVEFLERGLRAARSVGRVLLSGPDGGEGFATGFLVAPRLLLTNRHVLPRAEVAAASLIEFGHELDAARLPRATQRFRLRPQECFVLGDAADDDLDFALVAVAPEAEGGGALAAWGWLRLDGRPGKIDPGEWITIVQHPGGAYKQVALRENRLVGRDDARGVLTYVTDTAPGSSGAPCFNDQWQVVALHSRGVPEADDQGRVLLTGGRPPVARDAMAGLRDADVRWVANQGVRASRIVAALRAGAAGQPLVRALLDDAETGGGSLPPLPGMSVAAAPLPAPQGPASGGGVVTAAGLAGVEEALSRLAAQLGGRFLDAEASRAARRAPARARPAAGPRDGHDPRFLGGDEAVPLPLPGERALRFGRVALNRDTGAPALPYTHFSVVMCAERRLAFATAVDIDGRGSVPLTRGRDAWRYDARLSEDEQAGDWLYREAGDNFFDRGHLVRRLDPCWGSAEVVRAANEDTFHWTNCAPQHWSFNQGELLWNGLENYVLGNTDAEDIRATVLTGPVFRQDDPVHRDVPIPRDYWKVVVVRDRAGRLRSSGYTLSQASLVARIDFEELPVGRFRTFQQPVARIAALTGLEFGEAVLRADVLAVGERVAALGAERPEPGGAGGHELLRLGDVVV